MHETNPGMPRLYLGEVPTADLEACATAIAGPGGYPALSLVTRALTRQRTPPCPACRATWAWLAGTVAPAVDAEIAARRG